MKITKLALSVLGLLMAAWVLSACSSSEPSNFPTGRFMVPGNDFMGFQFNEDGTWYAINYGQHDPSGTYSVKGDLFIEESNNHNCGESPMSYRYTFDGTNLKFELTEESQNDICEDRRNAYDGTTFVLTE